MIVSFDVIRHIRRNLMPSRLSYYSYYARRYRLLSNANYRMAQQETRVVSIFPETLEIHF